MWAIIGLLIDDVSDVCYHGDEEWASHYIAGFRLIYIRGLNFGCIIDTNLDTIFERYSAINVYITLLLHRAYDAQGRAIYDR